MLKIDNVVRGIPAAPAPDRISREQMRELIELVWDIQERGEHYVSCTSSNPRRQVINVWAVEGGLGDDKPDYIDANFDRYEVKKYSEVIDKLRKLLPDAATPESNNEK